MVVSAAWDRYWFAPTLAARVWLLHTGTLLLLAFDVWTSRIGPAWRYGAGHFNVAHFAGLDALLPAPTPALQVAAAISIGLGALVAALLPGRARPFLVAVLALHTWAWAASMQNSYQHHYLVSWILAALLLFPPVTAVEAGSARASAWGYVLVGVTCSIVYFYGAAAKLTPAWLDGSVLDRMTGATTGALLAPVVVLAEIVCCLGYALAPLRDRGGRPVAVVCTLALVAALGLHLGAEYLALEIGWFSWYMVFFALVFFLPGASVSRVVSFASRPVRAAAAVRWQPKPVAATIAAGLAGGCLALVGHALDLPGAFPACCGVAIIGVVSTRRPRRAIPIATAAAMLWLAVVVSGARYDFYRFQAADARRRGDTATALASYLQAERYAPKDQSRAPQIAELRRLVD
jgi:hypothetical protein